MVWQMMVDDYQFGGIVSTQHCSTISDDLSTFDAR